MKFNKDKRKVLPMGKYNPGMLHSQGSTWSLERDLGVLVDSKLNMSEHCAVQALKASRMLGCTNKSVTSRDALYSPLVWPHLEYCVWF